MKIGRILKYLLGAIVVLIVAAVVVLMAVDFNDYKPELQAQVKQATGRDLKIGGDIKLSLSLTPSLGVGDVSFANAAWGSRPNIATVERFEVEVALIPLISGTIDIQRVLLKGADVLLETNADGQANYQFETQAKDEKSDGAAPTIPVLRNIVIEDAKISYRDGVADTVYSVAVSSLSLQAGGVDQPIALNLAGAYNDNPVTVSGTLGSRTELLSGGSPYPVDLNVTAGGAKVGLKGAIANPLKAPKLDLNLSAAANPWKPCRRWRVLRYRRSGPIRSKCM